MPKLDALQRAYAKAVLAGTGTAAGSILAQPYVRGLGTSAFKPPFEDWQDASSQLAKEMDVKDVPIFTSSHPLMRLNAFYSPGGLTDAQVKALGVKLWDKWFKKRRPKHGVIVMGPTAPSAVLAHEMGHAAQQKERGPIGRKLTIPAQNILSSLSMFGALGGAALGKLLPGRLGKLLLKKPGMAKRVGQILSGKVAPYLGLAAGGLGTGYAMNYPRLSEEHGASEKAIAALTKLKGVELSDKLKDRLAKAYKTYQVGAAIPTVAGTLPALL